MGSRGSFLESGGFSTPAKWHTVDYVDGIKVLLPKDTKASISLPERSNTPGTSYLSYRRMVLLINYEFLGMIEFQLWILIMANTEVRSLCTSTIIRMVYAVAAMMLWYCIQEMLYTKDINVILKG